MKKRLIYFFALVSVTIFAQGRQTITYGNNAVAGNYKHINGIRMYFESYGHGHPLLLLHGNGGSIAKQSDRIRFFQQYFRVIAVDSRGHGKSVDTVSKVLTYDQMANDIKVLLDSIKVDSAFIWGQSDGGILGLIIAIKYPEKVSRVAAYAANIFPGDSAIYKEIDDLIRDTLSSSTDQDRKRLYSLMADQPHISTEELRSISAPVLIMAGDRDAIRLKHSALIFESIPNSNLFIMPGATHFGASEKPALFNMVLLDFFTKPFSKISSVEKFTGKAPAAQRQ